MHADESQFHAELRAAMRQPSPVELLRVASALIALPGIDPAEQEAAWRAMLEAQAESDASGVGSAGEQLRIDASRPITPTDVAVHLLVPALIAQDVPELNAVLRVWGEMLGDEGARLRIAHAVSRRDQPAWLDALSLARVDRAVSVTDVFGERETLLVGVVIAEERLTVACDLHTRGTTVIEDADMAPLPLESLVTDAHPGAPGAKGRRELSLATAGARLAKALAATINVSAASETDSWPAVRPALEWIARLMPGEGTAVDSANNNNNTNTAHDDRSDELRQLADEFRASPEASALPKGAADQVETLLRLRADYGSGDALRWGPRFVHDLMTDLYVRSYHAPDKVLLQLPALLSALVQWANTRSGISASATALTLHEIAELTPKFQGIVAENASNAADLERLAQGRPPKPKRIQRSKAPAHAYGQHPMDDFLLEHFPQGAPTGSEAEENAGMRQFTLYMLELEVGSRGELATLTDKPLPPISFSDALAGYDVPTVVAERLRTVAPLIAERLPAVISNPVLVTEIVTIAYRVLARSAAGDPGLYRRRAHAKAIAAAACWVAAAGNGMFTEHEVPGFDEASLAAAFDLEQLDTVDAIEPTLRERGEAMVRAMRITIYKQSGEFFFGDPGFYTQPMRADIIWMRDHRA
ncbi:hypothetical protein ACXR2T_06610 [Leucobacter sp. HY1910]